VAVTVQGEPEGIAAPVVSALWPGALKISWVAPAKPNGIIREYHINQSGVGVIHTETDGEMAYNVTGIIYILPFKSFIHKGTHSNEGGSKELQNIYNNFK